jgi:hypothetical protein
MSTAQLSIPHATLRIVRRSGEWWITGFASIAGWETTPDCGAYVSRALAELERKGMAAFIRYEHQRGFVTCEKKAR